MIPRVLLVADCPDWIFNRHCQEISKRLIQYSFETVYRSHTKNKPLDYYNSFDIIYILDSRLSIPFNMKDKTVMGVRSEFCYGHSRNSVKDYYEKFIKPRASAFHVVNKNQFECFNSIADIPLVFAPHGVDIAVFDDTPQMRSKPIVGINGSSRSGGKKGFDIVEQACGKLGLEVKTALQDFSAGHRSKEQMPDFYKSIDIYCNMSESEGLNNSILEAGAMGKVVVATPVGGAPEMIIPDQTGFLCARNSEVLSKKLNSILETPDKGQQYGRNLRELIRKNWNWDICVQKYDEMFKKILK